MPPISGQPLRSAETSVEVQDLTRKFGQFLAVNRISFAVQRGEIFGFLGPNGAGKSTTIRMLCGILLPTSGNGHVAGYDIMKESEEVKKHIGYMSQRFSLYPDLLARENLEFYAGIYGVAPREKSARIQQVAHLTGIRERLEDLTEILTGGWRQRLALACALLHSPPILFLDEPTSGADPISRRAFWTIIQGLAREKLTIFVTTHYLEEAEYCHRLALISDGEIVAQGTPGEMRERFPYPVLRVECAPLMEALALLQKEHSVGEISIWSRALHVVLLEGEKSRSKILEILSEAGVEVTGTEPLTPTLEDVFVHLTGGKKIGGRS